MPKMATLPVRITSKMSDIDDAIRLEKIVLSTHPKTCNCRLCSLEYCDCSEEQNGTVEHTKEYWEK